jgi:hypothetical protein
VFPDEDRCSAGHLKHSVCMKLTRSLGITALAWSALGQSQVESSTVMRTAGIIQVLPEVNELNELVRNQSDALKITPLRQTIIEKVLAASLEVDATIAQIDNEIAQSNEVRGYLSDKRDKAVNRANLLSIVSGGTLGQPAPGSSCLQARTKLRPSSASQLVCSPPLWRSPVSGRRKGEPGFSISTPICWLSCSIDRHSAIAAMTQLSGAF